MAVAGHGPGPGARFQSQPRPVLKVGSTTSAIISACVAGLRHEAAGLKVQQSRMRIDLLVTDVGLPGINGRQLADQARVTRPDLKVLFITGYAENATLANGFLEPGMQMITKPFAVEALATRISAMIKGE
jgi:DNA-binding response OmpR family regulator